MKKKKTSCDQYGSHTSSLLLLKSPAIPATSLPTFVALYYHVAFVGGSRLMAHSAHYRAAVGLMATTWSVSGLFGSSVPQISDFLTKRYGIHPHINLASTFAPVNCAKNTMLKINKYLIIDLYISIINNWGVRHR